MTATMPSNLDDLAAVAPAPVLIVSTVVGRGMYSLGEAVRERFPDPDQVHHIAIEDYLPSRSVTEDLRRYQWISNHFPSLLYLVYKVPIFYYRKYLRERWLAGANLGALDAEIRAVAPQTVVCVSHRPAFWVSSLKWRARLTFKLWGLLGEYGYTLGWKYIFWDQMNGFLSPVPRDVLAYAFPASLDFREIGLPARQAFARLADHPGDRNCALLVCGYWGQGPILRVVRTLQQEAPAMRVLAVCGENTAACEQARRAFAGDPRVTVYGAVDSLVPILREAGCVVTKPGISTLVEAHVAGRKIFLLKGMPVAEDNNARYAVRHFGAEWFGGDAFRRWYQAGGN
jgi:UDP-N-acetylglucosamine:LPS N-acetylglucosamine transferase